MSRRIRIMIAEDEDEQLRSLRNNLESDSGIQVVCAASNGCEIIEYLSHADTVIPDILLTDIRMPGMDGIQLIQKIHEIYPQIKTVLLTGYSNFEYARQAIKYGASEYLLKPVNPTECLKLLTALGNTCIESQKFDLRNALNLHNLVPEHEFPLYMISIFCGNYSFTDCNPDYASDFILEAIVSNVTIDSPVYYACREQTIYILFEAQTLDLARKIMQNYNRYLISVNQVFTMALIFLENSADLFASAKKLTSLMHDNAVFLHAVCLDGTSPLPGSNTVFTPFFSIRADALSDSNHAEIFHELTENLERALRSRIPTNTLLGFLKYQYIYTTHLIYSSASDDDIPLPYDWETIFETAFTYSTTKDELISRIIEIFKQLFVPVESFNEKSELMFQIKNYIEQHYSEKITNQTIGKQFGFVPSYISKKFKEYTGMSPCDYLTEVRINNACSYIRTHDNINFCMLSEKLGFTDSSYFSKIFKKITGLSPSEYKTQIKSIEYHTATSL